jgi:ribosomal-protein-alanine N-acetyltransferase
VTPVRQGRTVLIRHPTLGDEDAFLAAVAASRRLHARWVRPPSTRERYRGWLRRPTGLSYLVCRRDTGALVGVVNLNEVVRGALQSAYLGYYAFRGHEGQGLMKEGLGLVVREAFTRVGLHRLEANLQPDNHASRALAVAAGFQLEGRSPRYLKIAGRWRDHERWARLAR